MISVPRLTVLAAFLVMAFAPPAVADDVGEVAGDNNDAAPPADEEATPPANEAVDSPPTDETAAPPEDEAPPPSEDVPVEPAPETTDAPPSLSQPLAPPAPATGTAAGAPVSPAGITTVPAEPLVPINTVPEEPLPPVSEVEPPKESIPPKESPAPADPVVNHPPPVSADDEDEEQKFAAFSFSPQVGYAYFPESEFEYDGLTFNVDKRNSFVLKLHLDMGGDGLAFELAPLLAYQKIGGDIHSFSDDLSSGVSGNLFAAGGQLNIMVRGSWGSFFPHLGIGFHGTYLFGDGIEYGADIYGRIPVGFTWYVAKHLGVVAEFAFMLGVTGIRKKIPDTDEFYADLASEGVTQEDVESLDWADYDLSDDTDKQRLANDLGLEVDPNEDLNATIDQMVEDQVSKVIQFGRGYGFEFMVGIRFP